MNSGTLVNIGLIGIFLSALIILSSQNDGHGRKKRWLIWPEGNSRMQIILGLGIPLDLNLETAIIGVFLKGNYKMPKNSSIYRNPWDTVERGKRSLSRWDIYKILSDEARLRGHSGRDCVLKAICEAADTPVDQENGLFDELFHEIFTPTSTKETLDHYTDNEYYAAQKLGRDFKGKCQQFFPNCQTTFLEKFTQFFDYS